MPKTIEEAREHIAALAEADGELTFAREVRAGVWDHRSDVQTALADNFQDNLPLDGEVYVKDDVRVYIYRGYHVGNPRRCALNVKGEPGTKWYDRNVIRPINENNTENGS